MSLMLFQMIRVQFPETIKGSLQPPRNFSLRGGNVLFWFLWDPIHTHTKMRAQNLFQFTGHQKMKIKIKKCHFKEL